MRRKRRGRDSCRPRLCRLSTWLCSQSLSGAVRGAPWSACAVWVLYCCHHFPLCWVPGIMYADKKQAVRNASHRLCKTSTHMAGESTRPAPLCERLIKIKTNNNGNCWAVFPIFSASLLADRLSEFPCIHLQKQLVMITGLNQPILQAAPP